MVGCEWNSWNIGDGYCDDLTNNRECKYDGGDCCGSYINTQFCSECQCLGEPGNTEECPEFCTEEYQPLCGSDRVTYSNICKLKTTQCSGKPEIYIQYVGECKGKTVSVFWLILLQKI